MSRYDIDNYMPLLQEYARASATGYVLELGVGQADGSTRAFMDGLEQRSGNDRLMVSVDLEMDFDLLKLNEPYYWFFVLGDTRKRETLEKVTGLFPLRRPDILFIDTHHTYEQMSVELDLWQEIAGPDTTWLFHDTYMFGGYNPMTDAIKEFAAAHGKRYEDVRTDAHGLGMMK